MVQTPLKNEKFIFEKLWTIKKINNPPEEV